MSPAIRVVLLGAPASGKGTQGRKIAQALGVPKISTGDMLRAARDAGSELGRKADGIMSAGQLVPDALVINLVDERLREPDATGGCVLDGFPRTVAQADSLEELLRKRDERVDVALHLEVERGLLMERAILRRTDVRTGQIYHMKYNPPPAGAEVEHRADDREEAVSKRLDAYDAMTAALVPHYQNRGVLRVVDGVGSPVEVSARIETVFEELGRAIRLG